MKEKLVPIVVASIFLLLSGQGAHAADPHAGHEGMDSHKGMAKSGEMAKHQMKGKNVMLTGRLIGLTCFVKHGATGKTHEACARQCAENGLPLALKVEGQGIYVISGKGHDSLKEINKPLLKYVEGAVTVKGEVFKKEGVRMIVIEKIKGA